MSVAERPVVGAPAAEPTVWGLTAADLHRAFWASCGVACVELGSGETPERGADIFLLVEPRRAVYFDLRSMAETLLWSGANVTKVRIAGANRDAYSERVVVDESGGVRQIERRYRPDLSSTSQFYLTTDEHLAREWSLARSTADALASMRRIRRLRMDAIDGNGYRFDLDDAAERDAFVRRLVLEWSHPERVIEGIAKVRDGVLAPRGAGTPGAGRQVAPLWIGHAAPASLKATVVGPAVLADARGGDVPRVRVRSIDELFFAGDSTRASEVRESGSLYLPAKRLVDVVVSAVALVAFLPVMAICAAAVVAEDGFPVFFGHNRQARGGRTFRCWKFRTMRRNAEAMVAELRKQNLCDGPQVLIKDDPRVTRVGKWLRKLQFDELPQLWNVLVGDMSLVGPRPSPDNENQYCPAWRETRLSVRPGITGLWQVMRTRRPGMDFQEWIRYDIEYVERIGPLLDLKICILTVVNAVRGGKSAE